MFSANCLSNLLYYIIIVISIFLSWENVFCVWGGYFLSFLFACTYYLHSFLEQIRTQGQKFRFLLCLSVVTEKFGCSCLKHITHFSTTAKTVMLCKDKMGVQHIDQFRGSVLYLTLSLREHSLPMWILPLTELIDWVINYWPNEFAPGV